MSKSDPSEYSRINLTDGADDIATKIRKAKTDPGELPGLEALDEDGKRVQRDAVDERPEAFNLLSIYAALSGQTMPATLTQFAGQQFSAFKGELVDLSVEKLGPIGAEMQRLMADPGHVDSILADGGERAAALAEPVIREVHEIVGFLK
jgi:tryptophanyl-tRNA synthetase